jgi:hypothetical protein
VRGRLTNYLRRLIVRAAPNCTLWEPSWRGDWLEFRMWRDWRISRLEITATRYPTGIKHFKMQDMQSHAA